MSTSSRHQRSARSAEWRFTSRHGGRDRAWVITAFGVATNKVEKVTSLDKLPERAVPAIWKPGAARRSRFGVGRDVTRPRPMYQIRRMIGADPGAATLGSCRLHHERETRWRRAGVTTEPGEGWSDGMARICAPGKDSVGSTGDSGHPRLGFRLFTARYLIWPFQSNAS